MARSPSRPKSKPSEDCWAALLSSAIAQRTREPIGKGWKKFCELRDELRISRDALYTRINVLKAAGKIEQFSGNEINGNHLKRAVWYRIKK